MSLPPQWPGRQWSIAFCSARLALLLTLSIECDASRGDRLSPVTPVEDRWTGKFADARSRRPCSLFCGTEIEEGGNLRNPRLRLGRVGLIWRRGLIADRRLGQGCPRRFGGERFRLFLLARQRAPQSASKAAVPVPTIHFLLIGARSLTVDPLADVQFARPQRLRFLVKVSPPVGLFAATFDIGIDRPVRRRGGRV